MPLLDNTAHQSLRRAPWVAAHSAQNGARACHSSTARFTRREGAVGGRVVGRCPLFPQFVAHETTSNFACAWIASDAPPIMSVKLPGSTTRS